MSFLEGSRACELYATLPSEKEMGRWLEKQLTEGNGG
jgi:hypothetical protein